ncbi:MAG TPA: hypothetical protein VG603_08940 [Chitinophagales bacterium]|nr:hypothetical protein [Chitinophagales bacterium]
MNRFILITAFILFKASCFSQLSDVKASFLAISQKPKILRFNTNQLAPAGGHLQGIQAADSILFITASGNAYSYCVLVKNKQAEIVKLLDSPYRHAGGCQVMGTDLAVGIEDNAAKDKSTVLLLSFLNNTLSKQVVANRSGVYKRSTAGATGITTLANGQTLVITGDWDTRNIDFYISRLGEEGIFDSIITYHVPQGMQWGSYQSINLFTDSHKNIFMLGFCNEGNGNRADLFQVNFLNPVTLFPIGSRTFKCTNGCSFRYAAGAVAENGKLVIYTTQRSLKKHNVVNVFR